MIIRHANINDLDNIAKIEEISYPKLEGASKKSIYERIKTFPNCFWLLEEDDILISFINGMVTDEFDLVDEMYDDVTMHSSYGKWQMIFSVVTAPKYRGNGYASMLMKQVISDVKSKGKLGIVLTCKEKLIPFYLKFGFKNEGISRSTHGNTTWYQMRLKF